MKRFNQKWEDNLFDYILAAVERIMCLFQAKAELRAEKDDIELLDIGYWKKKKEFETVWTPDGTEVRTFKESLGYLKDGSEGWEAAFHDLAIDV